MDALAHFSQRRVAVLSTGRQDWGILRSTCRWLEQAADFSLVLMLGGMACAARFGAVDDLVSSDGFAIDERLAWLPDQPDAAREASRAVEAVSDALARQQPSALMLVGDRYETLAAALAATVARVPIIHLHGGEETVGAFDNAIRHAISKLAHLHLVSDARYGARLVAMGERSDTVHVVGAPALDNLHRADLPGRDELEESLQVSLEAPVVIVTVHPATLAADATADVDAVCSAMGRIDATYIITLPNSDPGSDETRARLVETARRTRSCVVSALGERRYFGLLRHADAMLGNSSSGIIEAPALGLPVVNVGARQQGRIRAANVIDAAPEADVVETALRRALSSDFRSQLRTARPSGAPTLAAERIGAVLRTWSPPRPPIKTFAV